ncbi:MAG: DUF3320 domain-containing protein [Pararhizobium sp.]
MSELSRRAGRKDVHPFLGVRRTDLLPTDVERLRARLSDLVGAVEEAGKAAGAVARSVGISEPANPRIADGLSNVLGHIAQLSAEAAPFAAALAGHGGLDRARSLAEAGLAYAKIAADARTRFRPAALAASTNHLRPMLAAGHSFFGRLRGPYRAASSELQSLLPGPLPKGQPERMTLLDRLVEWQQATQRLEQHSETGTELLGELWRGVDTDFAALSEAITWIGSLLGIAIGLNAAQAVHLRRHEPDKLRAVGRKVAHDTSEVRERAAEIIAALDLDVETAFGVAEADAVPFAALAAKLRLWLDTMQRLDEWSQLLAADRRLSAIVGDALPATVAAGRIAPDEVAATIRFAHAEALYRLFAADKPWATRMTADEKTALVGAFREREQRRRAAISRAIRARHAERMPRGGMGAMGFIRGEIARKRGHKPIRTVMKSAGPVVQQIKPVFLMSPISVAQYLPPGSLEFDLLVVDEASQVRPEEALGAIARARQVVVVGDRKQLPPTSFFDRMVADEEDDEPEDTAAEPVAPVTAAVEMESILTLCEARGLGTRMLEWHYRSRHPSLIEVSNAHFYDGRLVLFPAPSAGKDADGLKARRVDGAYDRGGKRHNVIEAEAVARAVAAHARDHPGRTLGVVTFSTAQRDQVTYWLDKLRQDDEALDLFMREGRDEEFFVKNIENVQGDERDVIFISVGYGPRIAGQRLDSMSFGPVSTEGGERRLNVLFTRARFKTEVFVSFDSGDIDLSRTRSDGARVFKHFLQAAETGQVDEPRVLDDDPDSDFEVSVANAIRALRYAVDHQVGSAGFRIDLAVRDPDRAGRYLLAVECDGATYHSAVWARERDRQRQEVLEGLGWRFHRVWSTDWFHRRAEEFRRLEAAIEAARREPPAAPVVPEPADDEPDEPDVEPQPEAAAGDLPDYTVAAFAVQAPEEPHLVPISKMAEIVERIVTIEGPVHQEEIARRVAALFGKQKAGSRIVERVETALLDVARRDGAIVSSKGFWLTKVQQGEMPLRNRSRAPLSLRRAALIPPMEIAAAIRHVLKENGALGREDVPRAVALLFGFQRTGQEFRPAVEPVVEALLREGTIVETDAGIVWNQDAADT